MTVGFPFCPWRKTHRKSTTRNDSLLKSIHKYVTVGSERGKIGPNSPVALTEAVNPLLLSGFVIPTLRNKIHK